MRRYFFSMRKELNNMTPKKRLPLKKTSQQLFLDLVLRLQKRGLLPQDLKTAPKTMRELEKVFVHHQTK